MNLPLWGVNSPSYTKEAAVGNDWFAIERKSLTGRLLMLE